MQPAAPNLLDSFCTRLFCKRTKADLLEGEATGCFAEKSANRGRLFSVVDCEPDNQGGRVTEELQKSLYSWRSALASLKLAKEEFGSLTRS